MSDTPLTDAHLADRLKNTTTYTVAADFARSLERRLSEAQEKIERVERERREAKDLLGRSVDVLISRTLLKAMQQRATAAEAELQRWRDITARKDPDDCVDGIAELHGHWQAAESRCAELREALTAIADRCCKPAYGMGRDVFGIASAALTKEAKHG